MKHRSFTIGAACLAAGWVLGFATSPSKDLNDRPTYGETGLPKNCRAIIQANINGYRSKQYTADEVLTALERNCGVFGYSWGE